MTEPSTEPRDVATSYLASMTAAELEAFLTEARSTGETGVKAGRSLYRKVDNGQTDRAPGMNAGRDLYRGGGKR